eukprot:6183377-Pleurochrysis_carterae.AAC.4
MLAHGLRVNTVGDWGDFSTRTEQTANGLYAWFWLWSGRYEQPDSARSQMSFECRCRSLSGIFPKRKSSGARCIGKFCQL